MNTITKQRTFWGALPGCLAAAIALLAPVGVSAAEDWGTPGWVSGWDGTLGEGGEVEPLALPEGLLMPGGGGARLCGNIVYANVMPATQSYLPTGLDHRIADDCYLVGTQRGICEVYSTIFNGASSSQTIILELWSGCPQGGGLLLASSPPFTVPPLLSTVSWSMAPLAVGSKVWVGWTSPDSHLVGPVISRGAEVGYTSTNYGQDNCGGEEPSCTCRLAGSVWGGFDVTISAVEIPSACCRGEDICTDLLPDACAAWGGKFWLGAYCDTIVCPTECTGDSLFGQDLVEPVGAWYAYTSDDDTAAHWITYDNFTVNPDLPIGGLHFWGTQGYYGGSWQPCTSPENPMTFQIKFYADAGGQPGAVVCSYTVTSTGVDTGLVYPGTIDWPLYQYDVTLDSGCELSSGWVSVQAQGGLACTFMWMSSYGVGDGAYQWTSTSGLQPIPEDLAFCLTGSALMLAPEDVCHQPGDSVVVDVRMANLGEVIRGGQFFLSYDDTKLAFDSAAPGDAPFTRELYEAAGPGTIDYAVGVPDGDPGAMGDAVMARMTFTALAESCEVEALVAFRPYQPPTRLSNEFGEQVIPLLFDLPAITIDDQPPAIGPVSVIGGSVDGDCQKPVTFSAAVTDLCCVNAADVSVSVTLPAGNAILSDIVINKTQTGPAQVDVSGSALVSDLLSCPASVYVTVGATDCCGNYAECEQVIAVQDTTPPSLVGFPADRTQNADAGLCTAVLVPAIVPPTGSDNCDPAPVVALVRSDGQPNLTDPYPSGVTTISWTVTDACGNFTTQNQTVTISADNELLVNVQLSPTMVAGPITRCITFELWNCATLQKETVSQELTFTNGLASNALVLVPCTKGPFTCITAQDKLHSLRRTAALGTSGTQYAADFTGDPSTGGDWLIGGNLDDDFWIDILDFGVFSSQWAAYYGSGNTTCLTSLPHADVNGDGLVATGDFTFIQVNFLKSHEDNCCGAPGFRGGDEEGAEGPIMEITVAELQRRGLGDLAVADLNGDGLLDQGDIAAFLMGERPAPPALPAPSETIPLQKPQKSEKPSLGPADAKPRAPRRSSRP